MSRPHDELTQDVAHRSGAGLPPGRLDALQPRLQALLAGDRFKTLCRFSAPCNLTGLPAIRVPCGFGDNGLPIGLQLVAQPFAEPVLYQAGAALERQVGRVGKVVPA
jgi:aspartyl-tRNA(Asn)/glutamyl-tRNA(Gln) amidotransferase subunit A